MSTHESFSVCLFSGGRGTSSIARSLAPRRDIELTILVNAYDDGLSTGYARHYFPGMLGPSDIRKNVSNLLSVGSTSDRSCAALLEHRLPTPTDTETILKALHELQRGHVDSVLAIDQHQFDQVPLGTFMRWGGWIEAFISAVRKRTTAGHPYDFDDCSFGNILFVGAYLAVGEDFNLAIEEFQQPYGLSPKVVNVTDGADAFLVGVKEDGHLLASEAELVGEQSPVPIEEILLIPTALTDDAACKLRGLPKSELIATLAEMAVQPNSNPSALATLAHADVIIYGPGTQHSSLFPSYMTTGVGKTIAENTSAEKIFVSNIEHDHDIQGETTNTLLSKLERYARASGADSVEISQLVTTVLSDTHSALRFDEDQTLRETRTIRDRWQGADSKHVGPRVANEVVRALNLRRGSTHPGFRHTVSIVIPVLNEVRTIEAVLNDVTQIDFSGKNLLMEVIVVDGGSTDGTIDALKGLNAMHGIRVLNLPSGVGRGAAIRAGAAQCIGDIIVMFPGDAEYSARDIIGVVSEVMDGNPIVFGSRAGGVVDVAEGLRSVYGSQNRLYWTSRLGSLALSGLALAVQGRIVGDALTSLKAFDRDAWERMQLRGNGLDLETEIIAAARIQHFPIVEVPIQYAPRSWNDGKKTRVRDGLRAVRPLLSRRKPSPPGEK